MLGNTESLAHSFQCHHYIKNQPTTLQFSYYKVIPYKTYNNQYLTLHYSHLKVISQSILQHRHNHKCLTCQKTKFIFSQQITNNFKQGKSSRID